MNSPINLCIISIRYCYFSINTIFGNYPSIFIIDVMEINNKLTEYNGYLENADTWTRTRGHGKRGHGKRGYGKRDMENADMENADKHIKNFCMVDGLPCNYFGLPISANVSLKR